MAAFSDESWKCATDAEGWTAPQWTRSWEKCRHLAPIEPQLCRRPDSPSPLWRELLTRGHSLTPSTCECYLHTKCQSIGRICELASPPATQRPSGSRQVPREYPLTLIHFTESPSFPFEGWSKKTPSRRKDY